MVECIFGKEVKEDCPVRKFAPSSSLLAPFCQICPYLKNFIPVVTKEGSKPIIKKGEVISTKETPVQHGTQVIVTKGKEIS